MILVVVAALAVLAESRVEPILVQRWTSSGPGAARITGLVVDGQADGTVYAASLDSRARIFTSTDSGRDWSEITRDLLLDPIPVHLSSDPSSTLVLYAWRGHCFGSLCYCCFAELRRSRDGGLTWENLPSIPGAVAALAVDPADPAVLYADFFEYVTPPYSMGAESLPRKSGDGGLTWEPMSGLPNTPLTVIVPDPIRPSRVYAGGAGVFVSVDSGESWLASIHGLTDLSVLCLALDPGTEDVLYAGTASGVFRSADGGASWSPTSLTLATAALAVDPRNGSVFAGTDEGVFRSVDGGGHWSPLNSGLSDLGILALAIEASGGFLHAGTSSGVFDLPLRPTTRAMPSR